MGSEALEIDPVVLSRIRHFDLSGHLNLHGSYVVSHGGYGDVFKCRCTIKGRGEIDVAGKRLRFHVKLAEFKKVFEQEVYVWAKLDHPNVLPFLGYAFEPKTRYPIIISEWMHNGSAWSYLQKNPRLPFADIHNIILDISSGLAYLHESGVIHSDIKSDNVVISNSGKAMICDFGTSRMLSPSCTLAVLTSNVKGTPQFLAPELLGEAMIGHSKETDIWAFGMTVYELLTRQRPYEGLNQLQTSLAISRGKLPDWPPLSPTMRLSAADKDIYQLFQRVCECCWECQAGDRPDMLQVQDAFRLEEKAWHSENDALSADKNERGISEAGPTEYSGTAEEGSKHRPHNSEGFVIEDEKFRGTKDTTDDDIGPVEPLARAIITIDVRSEPSSLAITARKGAKGSVELAERDEAFCEATALSSPLRHMQKSHQLRGHGMILRTPRTSLKALSRQPLKSQDATNIFKWTVPPQILLVDDDAVLRKLSSKFLQLFGCVIDMAFDGMDAVHKMNLKKYDLVLMDIMMPKLDGVSATGLIRQFDLNTPIISMTSNWKPKQVMKYYVNGMNDILSKPFTKEEVKSLLEEHLPHLKRIQQLQSIPRGVDCPSPQDPVANEKLGTSVSTEAPAATAFPSSSSQLPRTTKAKLNPSNTISGIALDLTSAGNVMEKEKINSSGRAGRADEVHCSVIQVVVDMKRIRTETGRDEDVLDYGGDRKRCRVGIYE